MSERSRQSFAYHACILSCGVPQHFALDLPKYPCKGEANFSYDAASGKGSLAVELVSSSITSGYKRLPPPPPPLPPSLRRAPRVTGAGNRSGQTNLLICYALSVAYVWVSSCQ